MVGFIFRIICGLISPNSVLNLSLGTGGWPVTPNQLQFQWLCPI